MRLRAYIAEGGFEPGMRLPPERELTETLGMTRNALRRALDALEREGALWRHVGKGTFVSSAPPEPQANRARGTRSPADAVPHDARPDGDRTLDRPRGGGERLGQGDDADAARHGTRPFRARAGPNTNTRTISFTAPSPRRATTCCCSRCSISSTRSAARWPGAMSCATRSARRTIIRALPNMRRSPWPSPGGDPRRPTTRCATTCGRYRRACSARHEAAGKDET